MVEEEEEGAWVEEAEEADLSEDPFPGPSLEFFASSSFFCLSNSAKIFLCWSTLAADGLLKASEPGWVEPDIVKGAQGLEEAAAVRGDEERSI